jgi:flavodoxin
MSTLVVYYSRTGHNKQMAKQLHDRVGGDVDQIVDMKKRDGMFGCVMAAIFKSKTQIEFSKDPTAYDQVVVVTPLWGGNLPPATRTYLAQNGVKLNHFSFLSVCGKGEENVNALADVAATAKQRPVASLLIKEADVESDAARQRVAEFVKRLPLPA